MTAFAAIVWPDDAPPDVALVATVSAVLHDLADVVPQRTDPAGCTLLSAALHAHEPLTVHCDSESCATGQIVLEDRENLRRSLAVPRGSDVSIVSAAHARWEGDCARHLNGEYAFVVWSERRRELIAARDGLGVRLLYAADAGRAVIVSNVLEATLADGDVAADLDHQALLTFLAHGGPTDPVRTAYHRVRIVPPGHTLRVGREQRSLTRHWQFPGPSPLDDRRPPALCEAYRTILTEAVRDRLGNVGSIFLSGGVDSGSIASCLRELTPDRPVRAITAVHQRLSSIDEMTYARMTADTAGLLIETIPADRHHALEAHEFDRQTAEPLDEPSLADWRDFARAGTTHGTAALHGEGGDAIFAPPGGRALWRTASLPSLAAATGRFLLRHRRLPYLGLRVRERLRLTDRDDSIPAWLNQDAIRALTTDPAGILGMSPGPVVPHPTHADVQARLERGIPRSLATLAAPETTRQRLEFRFPYLDTRLLRFVVSVPPIPWSQDKALAREAFRGRLPPAVLQRPKTPVSDFAEAVAAEWRQRWTGRTSALPQPLDAWIDVGKWEHVLRHGSARDTIAAWRVMELEAWLTRRVVPRALELARV